MSTEVAAAADEQSEHEVHDDTQKEPADETAAADGESTTKNNNSVDQPDDAKGAPQAKLSAEEESEMAATTAAPASPGNGGEGGQDDEFEDCKISPLDAANQQRNLKSALLSNYEPEKTTVVEDNEEEQQENDQQSSLLHEDEYSQSLKQPHHPNNHESALASSDSGKKKKGIFGLSGPPFRPSNKSKPTRQRLGGGKQGHSHPRKSPYRSEVARLRHEQQQARKNQQQNDDNNSVSTSSSGVNNYNAPPDSSDFWKQSSKFKHMLLTSVGDFLTGAFADDEETSASYFSRELLDQLSDNDPTITGIWLQSKNLHDGDIKVLCDNLMRNTNVTEVWLPGNFITDEGAKSIAHMLKFNKSIKELFLGQNDIGPRGAAALAAALARGNTTLVALGLGENRVGVEGAGAFAAALRHNHVLRTLDLKKNGIPKSSSIRALLSKMLEFNASDPGDESLVLGLQEELVGLIQNLPEDVANEVVEKAEDALKTAMVCRRRGDVVGAAEAEGLFIRICTTGEAPIDPPEESAVGGGGMGGGSSKGVATKTRSSGKSNKKGKRRSTPSEPDRLDGINEELSALQFVEGATEADTAENHFNDEENDSKVVASVEEEVEKSGGEEGTADSDNKETADVNTNEKEGGEEGTAEESPET
ncbi:leucine-rich repeat protein [Skeletonema marinoi]|uniref:Leucine-rich repeat protein n=1 Tax=Skeletonema marinoi TaxID=267567 RepID=A0AAD9D4D1_9STRA|nr:leucine-rich repeat protein [Skeletonema marinoi]